MSQVGYYSQIITPVVTLVLFGILKTGIHFEFVYLKNHKEAFGVGVHVVPRFVSAAGL